jgi:hypothetical protein
MSYEPTFFVPENIIGYTGVLSKNPTVYFLSSTHYGHITQVHEEWTNVGREVIYSHASYGFGNQRGSLVEMDTGARPMDHTSRSPMTLIGKGTPPPELTHAIMVHSERKARHLTAAGLVINKTDETRARRAHPGQAPDDDERAAAANGTPTLGFWWTRTQLTGVPADSRLYEISRSILNGV